MQESQQQFNPLNQTGENPGDWAWKLWPLVPIYPYGRRRTLRREVVPGQVWTFDQVQGIFYVVVPIRMTIVKAAGGLLVYAPIAPTPECIRLVQELEAEHGPVQYIVLPTVSGLEHKVFVGPFARCFAQAQVFVAPNQWSFPLNLPLSWLGFPGRRTQVLPGDGRQTPFGEEFDYAILDVNLGSRSFGEVALFHRPSQTLLVTDTVVAIPEEPPPIVQLDPYPLLFHAKDDPYHVVFDTVANRTKGWQRIALFAFYFQPAALETVPLPQAFREARQAPDRSRKAYWGVYPFRWRANWQDSFQQLRRNGKLLVAPILQTLILNRAPQEVLTWAEQVIQWPFHRIIPGHLEAPISATPTEFYQAFSFLTRAPIDRLPEADIKLLQDIDTGLIRTGITPPAKDRI